MVGKVLMGACETVLDGVTIMDVAFEDAGAGSELGSGRTPDALVEDTGSAEADIENPVDVIIAVVVGVAKNMLLELILEGAAASLEDTKVEAEAVAPVVKGADEELKELLCDRIDVEEELEGSEIEDGGTARLLVEALAVVEATLEDGLAVVELTVKI